MTISKKPINHLGIICYLILTGITLLVIQFHLFARLSQPDYSNYISSLINTIITIIVSAGIALWLVDYTNKRTQRLNHLIFFKNLFDEIKLNQQKFNELPSIFIELKKTRDNCKINGYNEWIQPKCTKIKPNYDEPHYFWEYFSTRAYNVLIQRGYYSIIKGFSLEDKEKILDSLNICYSSIERLNNFNQDIENIAVTAIKSFNRLSNIDKNTPLIIRYIDRFRGVQIIGTHEPGDTYTIILQKDDGTNITPQIKKIPSSLRYLPENQLFSVTLQELLDQCVKDMNDSYSEMKQASLTFPGSDKTDEHEFLQYIDRTQEEFYGIFSLFIEKLKIIQLFILSFSIVTILYVIFTDYNKIPNLYEYSTFMLLIIVCIVVVYSIISWSKRCKINN